MKANYGFSFGFVMLQGTCARGHSVQLSEMGKSFCQFFHLLWKKFTPRLPRAIGSQDEFCLLPFKVKSVSFSPRSKQGRLAILSHHGESKEPRLFRCRCRKKTRRTLDAGMYIHKCGKTTQMKKNFDKKDRQNLICHQVCLRFVGLFLPFCNVYTKIQQKQWSHIQQPSVRNMTSPSAKQ